MKLSEIQGDAALEAIAELIDPVCEIVADDKVKVAFRTNRILGAKTVLKTHKASLTKILAILDGESADTYKLSMLTAPVKLMEILTDPVMIDLFTSAGLMKDGT